MPDNGNSVVMFTAETIGKSGNYEGKQQEDATVNAWPNRNFCLFLVSRIIWISSPTRACFFGSQMALHITTFIIQPNVAHSDLWLVCVGQYHLNYSIRPLYWSIQRQKLCFLTSINCCSRLFSLHLQKNVKMRIPKPASVSNIFVIKRCQGNMCTR